MRAISLWIPTAAMVVVLTAAAVRVAEPGNDQAGVDGTSIVRDGIGHLPAEETGIQELVLPSQPVPVFETTVELDGTQHKLTLRRHSLRSDGFKLLAPGPDGALRPIAAPEPMTYRGAVAGIPDSVVCASLSDGRLTAMIELDESQVWFVEPASMAASSPGPATEHVVYRSDDSPAGDLQCGVLDFPEVDRPVGAGEGQIDGPTLKVCEIAWDTDLEFTDQKSDEEVVLKIEQFMDMTSRIYERDTGIAYEITVIIIRRGSDPYRGAVGIQHLNSLLVSEWNANLAYLNRDVIGLATGQFNGGYAINPICVTNLAHFTVSILNINPAAGARLGAHELGHNWGLDHCVTQCAGQDCYIMNRLSCGNCLRFSDCEKNRITSFPGGSQCLDDREASLSLPFLDPFPTMTLDGQKWTWVAGAVVNGDADNEPSSPYALNLDALDPPELHDDDEARTNVIKLQGATNVKLSYYTQHKGVETGEKLVVEYRNDSLTWVEINTIVSDGSNQTSFDFWSHSVPSDGLHDRFRARFRVEADEPNDDWYIDDVQVTGTPGSPGQPQLDVKHSALGRPIEGAFITVSPVDVSNPPMANGVTPFTRVYVEGTPIVLAVDVLSISEPDLDFEHWELDGVPQPALEKIVAFTITTDMTATAVYRGLFDLTLESTPLDGVTVFASPDVLNRTIAVTPFTFTYRYEEDVIFSVQRWPEPSPVPQLVFCDWVVEGVVQPSTCDPVNSLCSFTHTVTKDITQSPAIVAEFAVVGDMNGDDVVNGGDIDPFLLALGDPDAYAEQFPGLNPETRGDVNCDGAFNGADLTPFFQCVGDGNCPCP